MLGKTREGAPSLKVAPGQKQQQTNRSTSKCEEEVFRLLKQAGTADALGKLCSAGCDRDYFLRILLDVARLLSFDRTVPRSNRSIFPSAKEVTKLGADIEELATRVERANAAPIVSPAAVLDALTRPRDHETDKAYRRQVSTYRALPQLLRTYAGDVRKSYRFVMGRIGPRRFSFERYLVQKVLEYVNSRTGQPHYESVQLLLESAFRVTDGKETLIPRLLASPDALKQLWARSITYGFRKRPETPHPLIKLKF